MSNSISPAKMKVTSSYIYRSLPLKICALISGHLWSLVNSNTEPINLSLFYHWPFRGKYSGVWSAGNIWQRWKADSYSYFLSKNCPNSLNFSNLLIIGCWLTLNFWKALIFATYHLLAVKADIQALLVSALIICFTFTNS